jgi:hypothetical protein
MNSTDRCIEFPPQVVELYFDSRPPADQHIIMAAAQPPGRQQPHDLPQPAPHAVTLDGIADLPRHRKADARRPIIGAAARLQHKRPAGRPGAGCGSPKVRSALQPLHGNDVRNDGAVFTH